MVLHLCKKSLFFDTNLKVGIYLGSLFLVSLIADFAPVPKTYMARSDNILNQYFVKFAWGWNLILLVPYCVLTSYTYCCGNVRNMLKQHLVRLGVATFFWWFWTGAFNYVESTYGKCNVKGGQFSSKTACLKAGNYWNGFDISGHAFILMYGSLVLIEEARSIVNWDTIKENIRLEYHYRVSKDSKVISDNPLRLLSTADFAVLQRSYERYTPYIRGLVITITFYQIMWDVMLVCTMLYYHIMIEKFLGGICAILTWFVTYRVWYEHPLFLPRLPGNGMFRYMKTRAPATVLPTPKRRTNSLVNGQPMFMGRPIYPQKADEKQRDPSVVAGDSTDSAAGGGR